MAETSVKAPVRARPLSPHLGIYRPMLTMMMSIVHRITGGALYFGTLLLAWWLIAAATGPEAYGLFMDVATLVDRAAGALRIYLGADPPPSRWCPSLYLGSGQRL